MAVSRTIGALCQSRGDLRCCIGCRRTSVLDPRRGFLERYGARKLHYRRTCLDGEFAGTLAFLGITPRAVQNHRGPGTQRELRTSQHLVVDNSNIPRRVQSGVENARRPRESASGSQLPTHIVSRNHARPEPVCQRPSKCGLSSTRTAADDYELNRRGSEVLDCDIDVPARICGRFLVSLRNTNAVDFGADYTTIGNIEVLQPRWRRVAGISAVRIEVEGGEILSAQKLDVHRQERCVINRVDVAQLVIEFQAVKYRQFFRCTEDIVCQQISVAVNDVMVGEALCEQRATTRHELGGKTLYLANGRMRDHGVWIALQLLEVLLPASSDCTDRCLSVDRPPAGGIGVKPCQDLGNRSQ